MLEPTFQITPGEKVFTIGSCFARNIEKHLDKLNFVVPGFARFKGTDYINKYNVFSILNEIKWAIDESSFPSFEDRFIPIGKGLYIDPYLHTDPTDLEQSIEMALNAHSLFKEIPECRIFIITLGLVEAWWDKVNQCYINQTFRLEKHVTDNEALKEAFHDRFEFHQLSFEDVKAGTLEMINLIKHHAQPDCRIILTVSPVPLITTFTEHDVMVANSYSKALLRTVAEEVTSIYDFVDYLPTYESITLSHDPTLVWEADGIHVRSDAVQLNIARMVEAYVEPSATSANPPSASAPLVHIFNERLYFQRIAESISESNDWIVEFLKQKDISMGIALYGTGLRAKDLVERHHAHLHDREVQFITTTSDGETQFMGFPKNMASDLEGKWPDLVILLSNPFEEEMLSNLKFMPRTQIFTLFEVAFEAANSSPIYKSLTRASCKA